MPLSRSHAVWLAALPAVGLLHLHLTRAEPAAGAAVGRAPAALRLWFSQPVEAAVTRVRLAGPAGAVALDRLAVDEAEVRAAVRGAMPAGAYTVEWRTMAADGHAVSGTYNFRVGAVPAAPTTR